jgi:nitrite reductase (NADH) small subunit
MTRWVQACALEELAPGRVRRVEIAGEALCLARVGDALYAVEDRCPHRGGRLSDGILYDQCKVACPDHGWGINLITGKAEPPEDGKVRTYPVELRAGAVFVALAGEDRA